MYKRKPLFITFEGIEGSGKSYQSKKLFNNIKKIKLPVYRTREPGGTINAERIRKIILTDYFGNKKNEKFDKYTDTLLYLAARNEHIKNRIKKLLLKKNIVICDRFIDSTTAYQVYGKGVDKKLINIIHKHILDGLKPDITFILKVNITKALKRLNKRKVKNRYDKFSKNFYIKVQKAFIKIAKMNKKRCIIIDNSKDNNFTENKVFDNFLKVFNK
tara:strand:+ start:2898 stop:3545 length:648 start_codon:yes stop_codon:yes gene_type:complete